MASDAGRKDMGDKVSETVTPDSQKSTVDQVQEKATGAADKVASSVQPNDDKSGSQQMMDTSSSGNDKSTVDSIKDTLGMGNNK